MRWTRLSLILIALFAVAASGTAHARGRARVGVGVVIGAPLYWPGYYPWPYYAPYYYPPAYYPPAVLPPSAQPVYIEQAEPQAPPVQPSQSWYYCSKPQGYYPYVKNCPGGWQQVAPQPPGQG